MPKISQQAQKVNRTFKDLINESIMQSQKQKSYIEQDKREREQLKAFARQYPGIDQDSLRRVWKM